LYPLITGLSEVGFYGKLPTHGDFLRRRVSDAFVGVWDGWLQECIAASRAALADRWLDVYLTSPVWRFGCAGGTCGPAPVMGIVVPSVDRVGRYFPLTLVVELPRTADIVAAASEGEAFFTQAERLVVETLTSDQIDFVAFDEEVIRLGTGLEPFAQPTELIQGSEVAAVLSDRARESQWQLPMGSRLQLTNAFGRMLSQRLATLYEPLALWWTEGSANVEPSCLVSSGLPHPDTFAAMLDGNWTERSWRSVPLQPEPVAPPADRLIEDIAPPRFRSAAASDVGRVRRVNQDSFLERTEVGLWAVADGLGGHSDGEVASRMVCDALVDFIPDSSFEDMIEGSRRRLHDVNDHLIRAAARSEEATVSGSTVVLLMARGTRCAVLWAGDSRAYRWRAGVLEQLTRDHSLTQAEGIESTAITRAVGGEPTLALDVYRDRVQPGDRFLLCSDGLSRVVPEAEISTLMAAGDIRSAVNGLIHATLGLGAPDNVTAVIVEAFSVV
jgi:type VI secretion system protein ImpM